jgi:enoyl-CoA hydratase/carnithine racemase
MLLHCDLVFVSDDALLTTPFVNLALVPEAASSLTLPLRIGHARAFSMFAGRGRGCEGGRLGHRQRGFPAAGLRERARAAASRRCPPASAVTITKALMRPGGFGRPHGDRGCTSPRG